MHWFLLSVYTFLCTLSLGFFGAFVVVVYGILTGTVSSLTYQTAAGLIVVLGSVILLTTIPVMWTRRET